MTMVLDKEDVNNDDGQLRITDHSDIEALERASKKERESNKLLRASSISFDEPEVEIGDVDEDIDSTTRASMNCSVFLDPKQNPSVSANDLRTKILSQFMNVPEEQ